MNNSARKMPAVHPGEIIKEEYLPAYSFTQEQLAKMVGVTRPVMNNILNGRAGISSKTAVRLAAIFGTSARYWMNLQNMFDLDQAKHDQEEAVKLLEKFMQPSRPIRKTVDEHNKSGNKALVIEHAPGKDRRQDDRMRNLVNNLADVDSQKKDSSAKKG